MSPLFIVSTILGFLTAKFCAGRSSGKQGRFKSLIFRIRKYKIHIHHWFFSVIILLVLVAADFYQPLIYGILIGIIIQGLTYKNFYKIVYRD